MNTRKDHSLHRMASPINHALSTPEILEAVLLRLPIRDLLVHAQLVSHAWHDVTLTSPTLQEALFFRPQKCDPSQAATFNSLLQKAFPAWFKDLRTISDGMPTWSNHHAFMELDWISSEKKQVAYSRSEASWRRMLVVQPPANTLEILRKWSGRNPANEQRGVLQCENGVRMGLLYDLVQERQWIPEFGLQWEMMRVPPMVDGEDEDMAADGSGIQDWQPATLQFNPKNCVVLRFHTFVGCIMSSHNKIGLFFKSLGYEKIDVKFGGLYQC